MAFFTNVERWRNIAEASSEKTGVPVDLILSVIAFESAGDPDAKSSSNAIGLMQVIPKWHPKCGGADDLRKPDINITCGAGILMSYIGAGKWDDESDARKALASYNAGPNFVARHPRSEEWPEGTQAYVNGIIKLWHEQSADDSE